jgi:hypothetical protein
MHYRVAILVFVTAFAFSCDHPASVGDRLAVSLSLSADSIRVAQRVQVRVVGVNRAEGAITVNAKGCPYAFVVTDVRGTTVGPESVFCTGDLVVRELNSGDSLVFQYDWVPRRLAEVADPPLLSSGTYRIRGQIVAEGGSALSRAVILTILP